MGRIVAAPTAGSAGTVPGELIGVADHLGRPDEDLVMLWVITPPGLENFFEAIGRPREASQPAPAPFERPTDVIAIERRMGMNDTK